MAAYPEFLVSASKGSGPQCLPPARCLKRVWGGELLDLYEPGCALCRAHDHGTSDSPPERG